VKQRSGWGGKQGGQKKGGKDRVAGLRKKGPVHQGSKTGGNEIGVRHFRYIKKGGSKAGKKRRYKGTLPLQKGALEELDTKDSTSCAGKCLGERPTWRLGKTGPGGLGKRNRLEDGTSDAAQERATEKGGIQTGLFRRQRRARPSKDRRHSQRCSGTRHQTGDKKETPTKIRASEMQEARVSTGFPF